MGNWTTAGESRAQQARIEKLEKALQEISKSLPCDSPCNMSEPETCDKCWHKPSRSWCAGCIAREALSTAPSTKRISLEEAVKQMPSGVFVSAGPLEKSKECEHTFPYVENGSCLNCGLPCVKEDNE